MPRHALVVAAFAALVNSSGPSAVAEKPAPQKKLTVEYLPPTTPGVGGIPFEHVQRMRVLIDLLERQIALPNPITVSYRECGEANAAYAPDKRMIKICHELWDKRRALFTETGLSRETIRNKLRAVFTFTFFHEFGHALDEELNLPLLGRDEDAVDDIATLWMIRLGVGDAARLAAYGHHLRAQQAEYRHEVWDEHATGGERGFAIACLLYGANPQRHGQAFERMGIPAPKLKRCKTEFREALEAWHVLLGPHLVMPS